MAPARLLGGDRFLPDKILPWSTCLPRIQRIAAAISRMTTTSMIHIHIGMPPSSDAGSLGLPENIRSPSMVIRTSVLMPVTV